MNTTGKSIIACLPAVAAAGCAGSKEKKAEIRTPNVIYIMADDLGIGDLGCYGQQVIKTPAVDRLAAEGMMFTRHYAGSTVSAPSRCALLTGKHTGHSYIRGNKGLESEFDRGVKYDLPLAPEETTIAEVMKQAGYRTGCVGKWGLGGPMTEGHPNNHGFDYFFGYLGQGRAHTYYPEYIWENNTKVVLDREVYSHDLIMERALDFIRDNAGAEPFFLYLTPTLPHAELIVPAGELGDYDGMFEEIPFVRKPGGTYCSQDKPRATYAAMVTRLDKGVGMVMELLEELGIADNTMVIFTSDNGVHAEGGHDPEFFDSNGIYRGIKRDLYEGGIHTPFIVKYPGTVRGGSSNDHLSAFWDFMPTMCEMIGADVPEGIDGISYYPSLLEKEGQREHEYLYFEFHEQKGRRCIIKDGWKLVELNVNAPGQSYFELYDLENDPSEEQNVIARNDSRAQQMKKIMLTARTENPNWNF